MKETANELLYRLFPGLKWKRKDLLRVLKKRMLGLAEAKLDGETLSLLDLEIESWEDRIDEMWDEVHKLQNQRRELLRKIIKNRRMLQEAPWRLEVSQYGQIYLYSDIRDHTEIYEFLRHSDQDIYPHGSFSIEVEYSRNPQGELKEQREREVVGLHCSDGELYISFLRCDYDPVIIQTFILENGLEVDLGKEVEKTQRFASDLDKIRKILFWIQKENY